MPSLPIIENLTFIDLADGKLKTGKIKDTTYEVAEKGAAGLCPALPNESSTNKFLRQDGLWGDPLPSVISEAELDTICT